MTIPNPGPPAWTRSRGILRGIAFALIAGGATLSGAPARAQSTPKLTATYKDEVGLGFVLSKAPDWGFVPAQSHELNLIGKYSSGLDNYIIDGRTGTLVDEARVELLKFDRRAKPDDADGEEGKDRRRPQFGSRDFADFAKQNMGDWREVQRKDVKLEGLVATRLLFSRTEGSRDTGIEVAALVYLYPLAADLDVAIIGIGPGDKKKWGKWESVYDQLGKSFKRVALNSKVVGSGPLSNSLRDVKRYALEQEVAAHPGWELYETPNYFIVTSKTDDKKFIQELMERLEAIREVYEEIYPVALITELRLIAKERRNAEAAAKPKGETGDGGAGEGDGDEPPEPEARTVATSVDPMELSRCSVVRVCKDRSEYHSYGGPGGSAGYWSPFHEELVVYDDQKVGGRRNTWATLNHEAFHQYIFYFLGNLSPHSWYNEGNGDFFSGYQISGRKFKLRPFDWRLGLVKENIKKSEAEKTRGQGVVPLKELVTWTQAQYYGDRNKYGTDGGDHYAQGWSLVYFLRTGKGVSRCWNPSYDKILDTYLRTLVETDDLKKAVEVAFAGVDFDQLEACWKAYTLSL